MAEIVEVVHRRHGILEALESGPKGKPEITDATVNARSTVDRGIDELLEAGLVDRRGSEFELTPAGLRVLGAYRAFARQTRLYAEHAEALCGLDADDEFPAFLLDDAFVRTATTAMPTLPVKHAHEGLADADAIYSTVPVLLAFHSEFWEAARPETDAEMEIIFTPAVVETMDAEYPTWRESIVETGFVTPYVNDEIPSYSFGVIQGFGGDPDAEVATVLLHDDDGDPTAVVRNDNEEAVSWARETFAALRADAERIT